MFANDTNRVRGAVLCLSQDGSCTNLFENFSDNNLKGDLSNDTTDNPPLFSLVNTFKSVSEGFCFYIYLSTLLNTAVSAAPQIQSCRGDAGFESSTVVMLTFADRRTTTRLDLTPNSRSHPVYPLRQVENMREDKSKEYGSQIIFIWLGICQLAKAGDMGKLAIQ